MKKKIIHKRLTIGLSKKEVKILEAFCQENSLTYSETIRMLIREIALSQKDQ